MATAKYHRERRAKIKADPARHEALTLKRREQDRERYRKLSQKQKARRARVARRWRAKNRKHTKAYHATYHKNHLREAKDRCLDWHYGMSIDCYELMLIEQGNKCAICSANEPGGKGSFHVDHNHTTGLVCKLLCHRCNTALGLLRHDDAILREALLYVQRYHYDNARIITVGKAA